MNDKILVEGKYGHGAITQGVISQSVDNLFRPKIGRASLPFNWATGLPQTVPKVIKNQLASSACWGFSFTKFLEIYYARQGRPFQLFSGHSSYSQVYDPNGGVALYRGEDEALNLGVTTEATVSSIPSTLDTESFMRDTSWENPTTLAEAVAHAGFKLKLIQINKEAIAEAIRDYGAVMWIIQGENNGTWLSARPKPPTSKDNLWAHYMCSAEYILPNTNEIPFYNSWGDTIGDGGIQYFNEDYINSGYVYEVFTFAPFTFDNNLYFGLTSPDVKVLQRKLGVNQTGFFGPKTRSAVIAFQKANNITPALGFVGPITRAKLNTS